MKTYLVPVDFSETSINAANFAAALSHQTDVKKIILLNAYYVSPYETMLPNPDMVLLREEEIEANATDRIHKLGLIKNRINKLVKPGVDVSIHLNRSHLLRAVIENIATKNADVVIMGIKGNSSIDDTQIGSHVIKISKASPVPVIVVPTGYDFKDVKRVVVACDFNKVTETIPLEALKRLLSKKHYELLVVNIDKEFKHQEQDAERMAEETALYGMLKEFRPKYFYINNPDIINGILEFAKDKDAQMVIALPHKYSFLQSLLHDSVSQRLAEAAAVPVLLLK
jgi:nucleotide-binding universal stress UspA family protein